MRFRVITFPAMAALCFGLTTLRCSLAAAGLEPDGAARLAGAAREANRVDEAIPLYRQAVAENPKWTEGWWYLGTLLYDRDDYAGATPAFANAAALDPKSGTTLAMLGLSEAELGQNSAAIEHLRRARTLAIADDSQLRHVMLYRLGTLWLDRGGEHGDFENAQDALDELAKDGVADPKLIVALGRAVLHARVPDDSSALLRAAGHAEWLAAQRGKTSEAMAEYKILVASAPRTPNVQFAYGAFLLANNFEDEAVAAFQREIENSPDHLLARLGIAGIKSASDPAAAKLYAVEAVKLAPDLPEAHYLLGLALLGLASLGEESAVKDDVSQSIAELELAQREAPVEAKIPFALARAYARAHRSADAARARAEFSRLQDHAPPAQP